MTLAELQAVVAFGAPDKMTVLQTLLALAPLLAQRRSVSIDVIYAMPAAEVFDAGLDALATFPLEAVADAHEAMRQAWLALDLERMQQRVPK